MIRFLTAGESHGKALVVVVEGLPAGISIQKEEIDYQLGRRQLGYGRGGRMRIEQDECEIISGIRFGETIGSPVALLIRNLDWENWQERMDPSVKPLEEKAESKPRPGHGDLAGLIKYERSDLRDISERASARETAARVAAGALVKRMLNQLGIHVFSHVLAIGGVEAENIPKDPDMMEEAAETSPVRCADPTAAMEMMRAIDRAQAEGDTLGGVFAVIGRGIPAGLGSYVQWDRRLDGLLAQAMLSIPGIKGVDIGLGFAAAELPGSAVHDSIYADGCRLYRKTNHAGGLEAGVTNGEDLMVRAAMKPIPTLRQPLDSVDLSTGEGVEAAVERADVCAVPAAAVVGEAMMALTVGNALLEKHGGDSLAAIIDSMKRQRDLAGNIVAGGLRR
jgi:chorismate synthase